MTTHPLALAIGIAVAFLPPTALYTGHIGRAVRAIRAIRAHVERVRFHRDVDREWRAEERAQRAQDRAQAQACAVPDTDERYRRVMRTYYASQILLTPGDPYGALLACRWQVARQWRDALGTHEPEGGVRA